MNYCINQPQTELLRSDFASIQPDDIKDIEGPIDNFHLGAGLCVYGDDILDMVGAKCDTNTNLIIEDYYLYDILDSVIKGLISVEDFNTECFGRGRRRWLPLKQYRTILADKGFTITFEDIDNGRLIINFRKNV